MHLSHSLNISRKIEMGNFSFRKKRYGTSLNYFLLLFRGYAPLSISFLYCSDGGSVTRHFSTQDAEGGERERERERKFNGSWKWGKPAMYGGGPPRTVAAILLFPTAFLRANSTILPSWCTKNKEKETKEICSRRDIMIFFFKKNRPLFPMTGHEWRSLHFVKKDMSFSRGS